MPRFLLTLILMFHLPMLTGFRLIEMFPRQASFSFQCTSSWLESSEPLEKRTSRKHCYVVRTAHNVAMFFTYILCPNLRAVKIKQLREIFDFLEDSALKFDSYS